LDGSRSRSVFLTWEWIDTWWRAYSEGFDLLVLLARRNDEVLGIAPFVVRKASRRLEFFGQNKAYGEYLDLVVAAGLESSVTPAICARIAELGRLGKWRDIHLATMLVGSPNLSLIVNSLAGAGIEMRQGPVRICPFVRLPGTWNEYLALKGTEFTRRIRYNERRLARFGPVRFETPRHEAEVDPFFDSLVELHAHRWKTEVDREFFGFHRDLAKAFYPLNQLLLARLWVGSAIVAVKYDFVYDNKIWGYQGGWLTEFRGREVGNIMIAEILKNAIDSRLREYDFLEGEAWYKARWSTSQHMAVDLVCGETVGAYIFEEPGLNP
jgi:CelD/BcsL family acetyltransferase involved in cellulose biosynthesis